jgi:hypothetical protein
MEDDGKRDFIFTFGHGQIPGIGYFCRIRAFTHSEAREIMSQRTLCFATSYDSEEAAGVKTFGLKEVYWDKRYRGWKEDKPYNSEEEGG